MNSKPIMIDIPEKIDIPEWIFITDWCIKKRLSPFISVNYENGRREYKKQKEQEW